MKLHGVEIRGGNVDYIVIPRIPTNIVFKVTAIMDFSRFDALCPKPKPPAVMTPGGGQMADLSDPGYRAGIEQYADFRFHFILVETLRGTEGLEWESIDYDKPQTWIGLEDELKESGFSKREIEIIYGGCLAVNALDEEKLIRARESFLHTLIQQPRL